MPLPLALGPYIRFVRIKFCGITGPVQQGSTTVDRSGQSLSEAGNFSTNVREVR